MKNKLIVLMLVFLFSFSTLLSTASFTISTSTIAKVSNAQVLPLSLTWYKGSLYIAYDVINVTTNSSSTYIVKYSSNSTYTVFEESSQENTIYIPMMFIFNNTLYIELISFMKPTNTPGSSSLFHVFLYEYNGSTIVSEKVFNKFMIIYPIRYNSNSALLMESLSQLFSSTNITLLFTDGKSVSLNMSSIGYEPIIEPTQEGVLLGEIHTINNFPILDSPNTFTSSSSSNSTLLLVNWNGNIVYNKTLNLSIIPRGFGFGENGISFSSNTPIGSEYAIAGNYFYIINFSSTGKTFPSEYTSKLVKIYIPNGEVSSVLNTSSQISLLSLDNNLLIIKSVNNTLLLYSLGMNNSLTLLYKIPLKYKTVTRTIQVSTPQGIENKTVNSTVLATLFFEMNNYILVANPINNTTYNVTVYTINKAYSYSSNFNFSSAAIASLLSQELGLFTSFVGVGVPSVPFNSYLVSSENGTVSFALFGSNGSIVYSSTIPKAYAINGVPLVIVTNASNTYYIAYEVKSSNSTSINLMIINQTTPVTTTTTKQASTTTSTITSSSSSISPLIIVGIVIVIIVITIGVILLRKR
ncbi:hypothetical protein SJAV_21710 [Sulfurisphaera javensis]|uniref:Thermopsin n=1 Tax=Sulfurisphaera javensis TaxID=2049879 RepID=A0AAT9GUF7_9CREN